MSEPEDDLPRRLYAAIAQTELDRRKLTDLSDAEIAERLRPPHVEVQELASRPVGSSLIERIEARLEALRVSPRAASIKAGLGPDFIRTIKAGRSRSPRGESLVALAEVLQCDVGYLLGTQDQPFADTQLRREDERVVGVARLVAKGAVKLGWLPSSHLARETHHTLDIPTLPQFLPGYQTAFFMGDESFNRLFAPGTLLHTLVVMPGSEDLRDGDIVILDRLRVNEQGLAEIERSVRRVRRSGSAEIYMDTFTSADHLSETVQWEGPQVQVTPEGLRRVKGRREALELNGIVLRAYQYVSGPPLIGAPTSEEEALRQATRDIDPR